MPIETQMGLVKETTWGTPVVVTRFFEYESESIKPELTTWESKALRASSRGPRYDRTMNWVHGYAGSVSLPVLSKGFGILLEHMTGLVTTGATVDSVTTHTGTVATLCGKGLTAQFNDPLGACGDTPQAFTYEGGKIAKWTLKQEQGGVLMFEADLLFEAGVTATALATASYPATTEFIPWATSSLTIGGTAVPVKSWEVSCDNKLDGDRKKIRSSAQRQEPVSTDWPEVMFKCEADFESLTTAYNRVIGATAALQQAAVVITCNAPTLVGVAAFAGIDITMSAIRFDEAGHNVDGPGIISQSISGKAFIPSAGSFISVAYRSADVTP